MIERGEGVSGRQALGWLDSLREATWLVIVVRVALAVLAVFVVAGGGVPGPCHFELARNGWLTIPPLEADGLAFVLAGVWQRWDACWYAKIATYGYESGSNAVAFFPLLPALMNLGGRIIGSVTVAGLLIGLAATIVGLAVVHRLVALDLGRAVADRTILYLLVFPSGFFLFAPFSEALFLATTASAFYGARTRRWGLALVAGTLAGLARTPGVLLALPLAWEAGRTTLLWLGQQRGGAAGEAPSGGEAGTAEAGISTAGVSTAGVSTAGVSTAGASAEALAKEAPIAEASHPLRAASVVVAWLAVVAPVAAFAGFVLWASAATGLSPLESQDAWGGREFHPPWEVVEAALGWAVDKGDPLQVLNAATLVGFGVATLLAVRRLAASYTIFAASQLLLISVRLQPTPLTSTTRYLLVLFPVFVGLALAGRRRWFDRAWLIGSCVLLAVLATGFVRGQFIA